MVRDPKTGKYRRTRLFVWTLGYSRKAFRMLTFWSSARIWAERHRSAFRESGDVLRLVVYDNVREGVSQADCYDPTLVVYRRLLCPFVTLDFDPRVCAHSEVQFKAELVMRQLLFERRVDKRHRRANRNAFLGNSRNAAAYCFYSPQRMAMAVPVDP